MWFFFVFVFLLLLALPSFSGVPFTTGSVPPRPVIAAKCVSVPFFLHLPALLLRRSQTCPWKTPRCLYKRRSLGPANTDTDHGNRTP